jgi:hypothetical protein
MSHTVRTALVEQPCPMCGQQGSFIPAGGFGGFPPNPYSMETRLITLEGVVNMMKKRIDMMEKQQPSYTYGPPPEWKP